MASRTSTDPIEILLEMGVDLDDLSEQDYLGALMEAVATIEFQTKGKGDARSAVLRKEILEVRKKRKAADPKFKARKTKISASSFKKGSATNVKVAPKALPTSAIVTYQAPQTQEKPEKAKAKEEKPRNLLAEIAKSVDNIAKTLKNQYNLKKKEGEFDRKKAQRDRRKLAKENLKKGFSALVKTAEKIVQPVKSIFDKIFGFITTILLGKFLMKLVDWFSDPQNQKKIGNIIDFLGKHWPKLLSLYLVFGTGLGRFIFRLTKTLIGGAVRLTAAIAKLLAAKKLKGAKGFGKFARFLGGRKGKLLTAGLTTALTVGSTYAATTAITGGGGEQQTQGFSGGGLAQPKIIPTPQEVKKDSPKGMSSAMKGAALGSMFGPLGAIAGAGVGTLFDKFNNKDNTVKLSKPTEVELEIPSGGEVDGPGGTDKVPAMLTAGEFVMSRGAVQKYGVKTLEGMNAAGGGTNQPKVVNGRDGYKGGGLVGGEGGPKGGFNLLNPFSWFSGQSQQAIDKKETGAYSNDSLSGRLLNRTNATNEAIRKMRGQGGPYMPSLPGLNEIINYGVSGQREVEERLANLVRQGEELIPRLEQGIVGLAMGAQEVARQIQPTLENAAVSTYRQAEQFAGGLANAGQQVVNDVVNYYESGQMQKQLMTAADSVKNAATGAVNAPFDALISATGSKPYQDYAATNAAAMDETIKISDSIIDSLPEGSPLQDVMDKGLIPIPTSNPGMMRNMTFVKALLGPLGKPFKIMSNPEVDRMRQLTIDKTLEKSGLIVGKDGEVKMNWNQEDINKGAKGGGAYTDDLGPGGKAFNSILGRFHATTRDGGNVLYTDDRYNFNKSTAEYLQKAKDQMLGGAFGEAAYFGAAALGKFAEDVGWLNQRALGSRIAVGEVDRSTIEGAAPTPTPQANVSEALRQYESGNYDAATKALGGDPTKDVPIPQLTAPAPQPGKPKREWYDPRGWIGMQYGGEVNGSLKMGRNAPKISAPGAPMQAKVTVIKVPKTGSTGATPSAPRGGSLAPDFNAGNGSPSKHKILGIA